MILFNSKGLKVSSCFVRASFVVFMIGSAAGKIYRELTLSEMAKQVIIEELAAIVGIKAQEGKRKHFFKNDQLTRQPG